MQSWTWNLKAWYPQPHHCEILHHQHAACDQINGAIEQFSTNIIFEQISFESSNQWEAVVQRCSLKKVFLENSQKFTGKHSARVSFLIELQASACNFIRKETLAQVFSCEICEFSKNIFLHRTPPVAVSDQWNGIFLFKNKQMLSWLTSPIKQLPLSLLNCVPNVSTCLTHPVFYVFA